MKVRIIRNTVNGPTRGDVLDLPDADAKALICTGTAEPAPETTEAAPAPETAPEPTEEKPKLKAKTK